MSDNIPQDVLIDILARLPAENLVRFTSVCKSWHSLITSPEFISHHLHRTTSVANHHRLVVRCCTNEPMPEHYSLFLDGNDSFRKLKDLDFPSLGINYFFFVGSCNGLVCVSHNQAGYTDDFFVLNPSIRKTVSLPKPNISFESHCPFIQCVGFGFDPVTNDYKVVRVVHAGWGCDKIPLEVEIYTLNTGCWRLIREKALPFIIRTQFRQAYVNGAAHWLAFTQDPFRNTILSFSMSDEVFNEILFPDSITPKDSLLSRMILVVIEESLSLIQHCALDSDRHCSIWIMREYGVATSWAYLFRIDLGVGLRLPLGCRKNGQVIFATNDGNLVSFDHQGRITHLGIHGTFGDGYSHWDTVYTDTYVESLVLLGKLENPEDAVVSGGNKKKKKKKKKQNEEGSR